MHFFLLLEPNLAKPTKYSAPGNSEFLLSLILLLPSLVAVVSLSLSFFSRF